MVCPICRKGGLSSHALFYTHSCTKKAREALANPPAQPSAQEPVEDIEEPPRALSYREMLVARRHDYAAARNRALLAPLQAFYGV